MNKRLWMFSLFAAVVAVVVIAITRRSVPGVHGPLSDALAGVVPKPENPAERSMRPARSTPRPASPDSSLFVGDLPEGTFLQLHQRHRNWPEAKWREEFEQLSKLGMKILILQWTQHEQVDFSETGKDQRSCLDQIMAAADSQGMSVYVGLSLRNSWWKAGSFTARYVAEELDRNRKLSDRLYHALKQHASFRGWYLPQEVTDVENSGAEQEAVIHFFSELTAHLHKLDALKPVLASGYTDAGRAKLVHFVSWWTIFLREAGVDIVLFQDGAGIRRQGSWRNVLPLVEALVSVADEFGHELWLVPEVFTQTHGQPVDDKPFAADSADFARVREQFDALGNFNLRLITYSYFDYMRPESGAPAKGLNEAMQRYVDEQAARARKRVITSTRPATWRSAR
jgi:Domain of unknown function (DUF4434)